ncbi:MAG: tetratricopeptide repeat protein [bacterium]
MLISIVPRILAQDLNEAIKFTRSEQFAAAEKLYNVLLQQNPSDGTIYFYYGDNYLKQYFADTMNSSFQEMTDAAQALFVQGIQKEPSNPLNYVGLAEISLLKKNRQESQSYLDKAYSLLPTKKNKIVLSPEKHATTLIKMADAFVKANVNDTAYIFSYLREAEKLYPKDYELYLVQGDAYIFLLNNGSKAIANYNIAQSLNPKSPMAKLRIGQLWMRAKQYQMALNYYEEGIKIDSTFAPAYRELGFLLSKAGRNAEAKKMFKKYLELSAENISARSQYINTLIELQDYEEAIVEIKSILAADTTIIDLYRALAYSQFENANYDEGLIAIRKFFDKAPKDKIRVSDYIYYGRLLAKNKQDSLAAIILCQAYEIDTTKTDLLSEVAMCYNREKDYENAIRIYEKKDLMGLANALDLFNLAKDYYNIQAYEKSAAIFERFTAEQPTYVPGYVWWARTLFFLDPESDTGRAKPVYEKILEITKDDTVANKKDRLEAYYYLAYFYYHQYVLDKKNLDNARNSFIFNNYVLAIDPENSKAKMMIDELKKVVK